MYILMPILPHFGTCLTGRPYQIPPPYLVPCKRLYIYHFPSRIFERYFNFLMFQFNKSLQLVKYLFTSFTTINIKIHTIKCYKFLVATCFGRPCDHHQANFNRSCAFIVHYEGARSVKHVATKNL